MRSELDITVIIPFYYGNKYMKRLLTSIEQCSNLCDGKTEFEIIIVNDSPEEKVYIPHEFNKMNIKIVVNHHNMGIQKTRINGLKYAHGGWILFLDQDDELISDGFLKQISLTHCSDVVIGNGLYQYGESKKKIFHSYKEMRYLIQLSRFIQIRNLIPSPGECLIKKEIIPTIWKDKPLKKNGADDWLLWIFLFKSNVCMNFNLECVYIHNDTNGKNLSSDLDKMKKSADEMYELLVDNNYLDESEKYDLKNVITFKYLQDTKKLEIKDLWRYRKTIVDNINYKIHTVVYRLIKGE